MRNALLNEGRSKREVEEEVNCTWTIQVGKTRNKKKAERKRAIDVVPAKNINFNIKPFN